MKKNCYIIMSIAALILSISAFITASSQINHSKHISGIVCGICFLICSFMCFI